MRKSRIAILIILVFALSIGNVKASTISNSKWNLHFENINIVDGSVLAIEPPTVVGSSNSEITYSVNLSTPEEFYEFTVDVVNSGSIDAMVSEINNKQLTAEQEKYLSYEVTYLDGTKVNKNDLLKAGNTVKLRIRLEFKKDITADDLPKEDTTIFLSLNACYVQADENAQEPDANTSDNNENNTNENSSSENNKDEDNNNKDILDFINNPKTGDIIIMYVIVLILALIALLITRKKSNKEK